jgi:hypothetical protein
MLDDNILGVGLEVAELALESLDLGAMLARDVDAELDLGGECLPAVGTEDVAGQPAPLQAPVVLDVHMIPGQKKANVKN